MGQTTCLQWQSRACWHGWSHCIDVALEPRGWTAIHTLSPPFHRRWPKTLNLVVDKVGVGWEEAAFTLGVPEPCQCSDCGSCTNNIVGHHLTFCHLHAAHRLAYGQPWFRLIAVTWVYIIFTILVYLHKFVSLAIPDHSADTNIL